MQESTGLRHRLKITRLSFQLPKGRSIVLLLPFFLFFFFLSSNKISAASLKFESFRICYNGTLVQKPFYYGTLYEANWRYRFRIRNYSNKKTSGTICYSDSFSLSRSYCYARQGFTVAANSYVDVYNTASNTYVRNMAFGLQQTGVGGGDPFYFVDVRYPPFLISCLR